MHFQRYSSYTTVRQEGRYFDKASTYTCQGLGSRSLKLLLTDSDNTLTTEAELSTKATKSTLKPFKDVPLQRVFDLLSLGSLEKVKTNWSCLGNT